MKAERVDLVVAAAHELKAPLVLIRHLSQSLNEANLPAEQRETIERIVLTAERSLRLANQLTSGSRLENIKDLDLAHTLEPTNVKLVCEQALSEMCPYAAKFDQTLRLVNSKTSLALANKEILHDVIVNLVDNSVRHNPNGGVVELSAGLIADRVRLKIKDDGLGIEKSEFRLLNDNIGSRPQPFYARSGSSGLGLFVASRLTAAMGGELRLGRAKQGTSFVVDLLKSHQLSLGL